VSEPSNETWRPIPGWEDFYLISDRGRVCRLIKAVPGNNGGYLQLNLHRPGVTEHWQLHLLVALTYLGERPEGLEVCHDDGDVANCAPGNLRYDTKSANELDKRRHGTHHHSRKTHCPHGHEYTPENTYVDRKGSRNCRACHRDRSRRQPKAA
jgi:hypothetical protein